MDDTECVFTISSYFAKFVRDPKLTILIQRFEQQKHRFLQLSNYLSFHLINDMAVILKKKINYVLKI